MTYEMELLNKFEFWRNYSENYSDEYMYHDAQADPQDLEEEYWEDY
jgi:hypothetical protein